MIHFKTFFSFFAGPSKKMAKNAAAKAALAHLCNISFSPVQQLKLNGSSNSANALTVTPSNAVDANYDVKGVELPQTFADCVGKYVI
jgi:double stranded RNA-specific editase B